MSYIDQNLMTDERVVYRTHPHWIRLTGPALATLLFLLLGLTVLFAFQVIPLGLVCLGLAGLNGFILLLSYVKARSQELAVTNKRVLVKSGILRQQSIEILLSKVEAIVVNQTVFGRLLNYGSITVGGTGGTKESFHNIRAPHEFRSKVHEQSAR
jgi:uncharacterized membrane protein YdbT with pleckstrin-like domain